MNGVSAHGTRVEVNGVEIHDLLDVMPPPLMRRDVEDTRHIDSDDRHEVGTRHLGPFEFEAEFLPATGEFFIAAWQDQTLDEYAVFFPSGGIWRFNGYIESIVPKPAQVEGLLAVKVTVIPTGTLIFATEFLLQENGDFLLLEDGGRIIING